MTVMSSFPARDAKAAPTITGMEPAAKVRGRSAVIQMWTVLGGAVVCGVDMCAIPSDQVAAELACLILAELPVASAHMIPSTRELFKVL